MPFQECCNHLNSSQIPCCLQGYVCEGVEGQDVVALLEAAIAKRPALDIKVDALLNDTTGKEGCFENGMQ